MLPIPFPLNDALPDLLPGYRKCHAIHTTALYKVIFKQAYLSSVQVIKAMVRTIRLVIGKS